MSAAPAPVEVVSDYEKTIVDELDLLREAANASQLRHNLRLAAALRATGLLGLVPAQGAGDGAHLRHPGDRHLETLRTSAPTSRHWPSAAWRSSSPRCSATASSMPTCTPATSSSAPARPGARNYIAVDCGIVGSLTDEDQEPGAQPDRLLQRDHRKVAQLHIDSGWVPAGNQGQRLRAAIRTVTNRSSRSR